MRTLRRGMEKPCLCVFRAIFRACYSRFRECESSYGQTGAISLGNNPGPSGNRVYAFKHEEYAADFCLAARRALNERHYRLFRYVFLLGADSESCMRFLRMDRGQYFHEVYRIEEILGKYLAELRPYPLYPIDEYMGGTVRTSRFRVTPQAEALPRRRSVRLPMTA